MIFCSFCFFDRVIFLVPQIDERRLSAISFEQLATFLMPDTGLRVFICSVWIADFEDALLLSVRLSLTLPHNCS